MQPPPQFEAFLVAAGLAQPGEALAWQPLTGGVSAEIWRVGTRRGDIVVKQALQQLRVASDWHAPIDRNAYEWAWMVEMRTHLPASVPVPLAQDEGLGLFAMELLAPETHRNWKDELVAARVDIEVAAQVGRLLAVLHGKTAGRPDLLATFETTENFFALRLEPYLFATAATHPDLAEPLQKLAVLTAANRLCLVHGDISPKNILIGPEGPVFLDAECAWYGDPAFDLAFCLNHLLLGALYHVDTMGLRLASFDALVSHYLAGVVWESRDQLEARTARLLPGLMLARVDGKSPLEYLTRDDQKNCVRRVAGDLLKAPRVRLAEVASALKDAVLATPSLPRRAGDGESAARVRDTIAAESA